MNARLTSLALVVVMAVAQGCAAVAARARADDFNAHLARNTEAWRAAQWRLVRMCPPQPTTREAYEQGVAARNAGGPDPFKGCDVRQMKLTNDPRRTDDWFAAWIPRYGVVVDVHEQELRARTTPKLYDESVIGIARALAERADRGEITGEQLRASFNEAWRWLSAQMQHERLLLEDAVRAAEIADAQTLNAIASGLAAAAMIGLAVGVAVAPVAAPAPIVCTVVGSGGVALVTCH